MKKILAILLALNLSTILLAGCGENSSETDSEAVTEEPSETVSEEASETVSEEASETVSEEADALIMPDVVGQDYRLAQTTLEDTYSVVVDISFVYSDAVDSYVVISTEPAAGTNLTKGQTVTITASRGASTQAITVPNFLNMNIDEAQAQAEEMGLVVQDVQELQDTREKGIVIYQSLSAGTLALKGNSIIFYISKGPTVTENAEPSEVNTEGTDIMEVPEESTEAAAVVVEPSEAYTPANGSEMNTTTNEENDETIYTKQIDIPLGEFKSRGSVLVTISVDGVTQVNTNVDTSIGIFSGKINGRGIQTVTVSIDGEILTSMDVDFS